MKALTQTKTFKLFQELKEKGFETTINSAFSYSYDTDNNYLSIHVENIDNLDKGLLLDIVKKDCFDIELSRMAEGNFIYEIRRISSKKEFVNNTDWDQYWNSQIK